MAGSALHSVPELYLLLDVNISTAGLYDFVWA